MDVLWNELAFGLPERKQFIQVIFRILASVLVAGIIGYQREATGKRAGLRTHVLVSLGSTIFVLGAGNAGMHEDAVSRVIQGVVTGIGFIGAGTILKKETKIYGLTTAAGLWTTCAIGVMIGLGEVGIAIIGAFVTFLVLQALGQIEKRYIDPKERDDDARG
jgi:putative Mg2+ transporter-C (MgtC) family protein